MYDVRKSELDIDVETLSEEEKIRDASEMKDGVASLGKYLISTICPGFRRPLSNPCRDPSHWRETPHYRTLLHV